MLTTKQRIVLHRLLAFITPAERVCITASDIELFFAWNDKGVPIDRHTEGTAALVGAWMWTNKSLKHNGLSLMQSEWLKAHLDMDYPLAWIVADEVNGAMLALQSWEARWPFWEQLVEVIDHIGSKAADAQWSLPYAWRR